MTMQLVATIVEDEGDLLDLLSAEGLPTDDLCELGRVFMRYCDEACELVGVGSYEPLGQVILLRSIAVVPDRRGKGFGSIIAEDLMRRSGQDGARHAFAFTTGDRTFLSTLGFKQIDRADAPEAVLETRQAKGLCPASASLWHKEIGQ